MFSTGRISYNTERLAPISGIAHHVMNRCDARESDYLAALWRDTVPQSLPWAVDSSDSRPIESCAPPLSWASVNFPVSDLS